MKTFSIGQALSFGWNSVKNNFFFFAGLQLASVCIVLSFILLQLFIPKDQGIIKILIYLIERIVDMGLTLGIIHIMIKTVDGKKTAFSELFSQFKAGLLLNYIGASIAYGLGAVVGFILLVIPGIIVLIRYGFYSYALVDKGVNGLDVLKISWSITKGNTIKLFLFGVVTLLINILGMLALVIGLLVTAPLSLLATAYVYRKLSA